MRIIFFKTKMSNTFFRHAEHLVSTNVEILRLRLRMTPAVPLPSLRGVLSLSKDDEAIWFYNEIATPMARDDFQTQTYLAFAVNGKAKYKFSSDP